MKHFTLVCLIAASSACTPNAPSQSPGTLTERKMIGLIEKFDRWDSDGNGKLDRAELARGLAGTDHKPSNVIKFYDTNGNGTISLREAQAGYSRADEADVIIRKRNQ